MRHDFCDLRIAREFYPKPRVLMRHDVSQCAVDLASMPATAGALACLHRER
jgi:hypothetical protein